MHNVNGIRGARGTSGLEGLLEIVGFEVMMEGIRAGTHLEGENSRL